MTGRELWTIGHWTCPETTFLQPLRAHDIDLLVDVRSQPGSRRNPQFDRERMPAWLGRAGIAYRHCAALGGRRGRQDVDDRINAGWQRAAFKNYADYTLSPQYQEGIAQLTAVATAHRVVIMCGEPMPWRCHRTLIANTLTAWGWTVWHLSVDAKPRRHELGQWGAAPVVDENAQVTYPPTAFRAPVTSRRRSR